MSQQYVTLSDGARLYVKLLGGNKREKPLVIVLHGAPGLSSHAEPERSFGFLQDQFRVLVYDARGSGTSDQKLPYTDQRWVEDVDELRSWAGAENIILAGGSYGGFIALQYALSHGNRLSALILRDTWPWGALSTLTVLKTILTSDRISPNPDRQVRLWSGTLLDDEDFAEAYKEIVPMYAPKPPKTPKDAEAVADFEGEKATKRPENLHSATQNAAFSYNVPRFDVRDRLKDITAATLVVHGRHDLIVPIEYGKQISDGIPNARLVVFEHSGHSPPTDEPDAFKTSVKDFLSSIGLWVRVSD
ncbi:hypothetical protein TruAng_001285 [Truncatella angustata]|nr:hypothetical protein TruAng_001285 [Truncatella angustata]